MGKVYDILVEGLDKGKPDVVFGRTRGNILVTFPGDESLRGQDCARAHHPPGTWTLEGELVESPVSLA